jgi:hypothetical protein
MDFKGMKRYPDNKLSEFFQIAVGVHISYGYIAAINLDSYDTDVQPNVIAIIRSSQAILIKSV